MTCSSSFLYWALLCNDTHACLTFFWCSSSTNVSSFLYILIIVTFLKIRIHTLYLVCGLSVPTIEACCKACWMMKIDLEIFTRSLRFRLGTARRIVHQSHWILHLQSGSLQLSRSFERFSVCCLRMSTCLAHLCVWWEWVISTREWWVTTYAELLRL